MVGLCENDLERELARRDSDQGKNSPVRKKSRAVRHRELFCFDD